MGVHATGLASEELTPEGAVLELEAHVGWDRHFYEAGELDGVAPVVDHQRIARDAERLAGVPVDVGLQILDGELEYLRLRGQ